MSHTTIPGGIILGAIALAAGAAIYLGSRAKKAPPAGTLLVPKLPTALPQELEDVTMRVAVEALLL